MKIGIVGSRRRKCLKLVYCLVDSLAESDIVVSGGCKGVDYWAEKRAKQRGLKTLIFKPDLKNIKSKGDMVNRFYARNKKIAEACDKLYAFPALDRKGGTENTIKWANKLGKQVTLIMRNRL